MAIQLYSLCDHTLFTPTPSLYYDLVNSYTAAHRRDVDSRTGQMPRKRQSDHINTTVNTQVTNAKVARVLVGTAVADGELEMLIPRPRAGTSTVERARGRA